MAGNVLRKQPLTAEEYLALELASPTRHEFVQGTLYAMGGASDRHNIIALNFASALLNHLPNRYQVFSADMKLRIRLEKSDLFYYPDVMVSCSPADRATYFREHPGLLVEVLSNSTERIDRSEKFDAYRQIAALEEYVLADQDTPVIEIFRRRTGWEREIFGEGDSFTLDTADLTMTVAQVYRRVSFAQS